jgi:hypothetical protein
LITSHNSTHELRIKTALFRDAFTTPDYFSWEEIQEIIRHVKLDSLRGTTGHPGKFPV